MFFTQNKKHAAIKTGGKITVTFIYVYIYICMFVIFNKEWYSVPDIYCPGIWKFKSPHSTGSVAIF